jgi:hypothetical protein
MDGRDLELLDKQMGNLRQAPDYSVIAVMLIAMFLIGMTFGSVLSIQNSEPVEIASIE